MKNEIKVMIKNMLLVALGTLVLAFGTAVFIIPFCLFVHVDDPDIHIESAEPKFVVEDIFHDVGFFDLPGIKSCFAHADILKI